jgi:hypothetical protein
MLVRSFSEGRPDGQAGVHLPRQCTARKASWVVVLAVCIAACDGGGDGFDPSSVTCTDGSIAAVIRLDFFSLEPKGYLLFTGDGEPVTEAEAAAIAEAAPADDYAGNDYEAVDDNPADGDVAVLLDDPGDFGGEAIVDLRTGTLLFKAGVVWGGEGEIHAPETWEAPDGLGHLSSNAPAPTALDVIKEPCLWWEDEACYTYAENTMKETPCTTGEDALTVVRHTRQVHEIAACGDYRAAAVFWARTVGGVDFDTAEWIVVLTGTASEEAR